MQIYPNASTSRVTFECDHKTFKQIFGTDDISHSMDIVDFKIGKSNFKLIPYNAERFVGWCFKPEIKFEAYIQTDSTEKEILHNKIQELSKQLKELSEQVEEMI